jgi:putative FmdB family regulatory protein
MPLYEYQCDGCGRRFEQIQKFSDPSPEVCVHCGKGPVRRLLSSPAIQFKGAGWYITDYARKGSAGDASNAESGKTEKAEKAEKTGKTSGTDSGSDAASSASPAPTTASAPAAPAAGTSPAKPAN